MKTKIDVIQVVKNIISKSEDVRAAATKLSETITMVEERLAGIHGRVETIGFGSSMGEDFAAITYLTNPPKSGTIALRIGGGHD